MDLEAFEHACCLLGLDFQHYATMAIISSKRWFHQRTLDVEWRKVFI
jgi:hypothetical protein